jgi:putative ABC transport system permease protein
MADPLKLYRFLLKLYPARFREEYGKPLEQQFADEYRDPEGSLARSTLWVRSIRDLAVSIPVELARELRQDVAYSFRIYSRRPGVTLLAVAAMALAIGATTGVFSVVNALLLRSLPFREPERIVQFGFSFAAPETPEQFHNWRTHSGYMEDIAKYTQNEANLSEASQSIRVNVTETTFNFFNVLGGEPEIGRNFAPKEDLPGKNGVAIISHGLWQGFYGGDSRTLGSTIRVNGTPLSVIGIAPPGLDYPAKTAIWTPTIFDLTKIPKGGGIWNVVIGRLERGMSLDRAQSMFDAERKHLEGVPVDLTQSPVKLIRLREQLTGLERLDRAAFVLLGAVTFVLLIACANVANLLLTRVTERRKELVLRAALGASRARLVQQLITESVLLTAIAAGLGLLVAQWVARLATIAQPAQLSVQNYTLLDWRVIGFAVLLAGLTGLIFGVLPASLVSRLQPAEEITRTTADASNTRVERLRGILVAAQVALTLALLGGSIVMGRGFLRMVGADLGYKTDHVVTMSVSLDGTRYQDALRTQYYETALDRLRKIPGVESAGAIDSVPLSTNMFIGAHAVLAGRDTGFAAVMWITPDYFRTMHTAMTMGRDFTSADRKGTEPAVIVNEEFARSVGQYQTLLGRKIKSDLTEGDLTIVGVVKSVRYSPNPANQFLPMIFIASAQSPFAHMTFVTRVHGKTEAYVPICRDAVQSVDRRVPVFNVKTLDERLADDLARPRFYTTAVLFFAGFALLLAVVGIYGVASYSIVQRTHELGVRIAVGASAERMRWMLLRQSLLPVAVGMAGGIAGAVGLGQFLQHLMEGAQRVDTATCAVAAVLLALVAAAAVWSATQRILRLDPMQVLRAE